MSMGKKITALVLLTMVEASLLFGCAGNSPQGTEDLLKDASEEASQEERTVNVTEAMSEMKIKGELSTGDESSESLQEETIIENTEVTEE